MIHLKASELRQLLTPVLPLAGTDRGLPVLAAVLIEAVDDHVTATATDRFRVGVCRRELEEAVEEDFSALIPVAELRRVLAIFKPTRRDDPLLSLAVAEGGVTITQEGALDGLVGTTVTVCAIPGKYPGVRAVIRSVLQSTAEPAPEILLNPHFLADFRHAERGGKTIAVRVGAANQPVLITCGDHFHGLIMTRRGPAGGINPWWTDWLGAEKTSKAGAA